MKDDPLKGVDTLAISDRVKRFLHAENIRTIGDLVQRQENELLKMPNLGRKSLNEIKDALGAIGLRLGVKHVEGLPASEATLRDYFATKAMTVGYERYWRGVDQMEADGITVTVPDDWRDVIATNAYRLADAMLRAREATP